MTVMQGSDDANNVAIPSAAMSEWNRLAQVAIEVEGYTLIGGKENENTLNMLVDVPFIIQNLTFRKGDITPKGHDGPRDYVSVEVMIHPAFAYKFPRRYVIFNDGGTGIYRQALQLLERRGAFAPDPSLPVEGEANSTAYDISLSEPDDDSSAVTFAGVNAICPEGVRKSEYPNEDGSTATTWYLA